ncbi:hypothetical protein KRR40_31660 [Niabella defluvii]|nr:hypothetical protein KRR40_31660 [Niabella sp. I65]
MKLPRENTTWYCSTRLWSETEMERDFWIGFGNISAPRLLIALHLINGMRKAA